MNGPSFRLAGLQFTLEGSDGLQIDLPSEYEPFAQPGRTRITQAARYRVASPHDHAARPPASTVLWQNDLWRFGLTPGGEHFFEIYDVQNDGWHFAGTAGRDFSTGTLYPRLRPSRPSSVMPLHHPHDRALIMGRLAHLGGGVVHSSCAVADGRAFLFVGRSGAGKTTMARLWRRTGATLVNDERNIVRLDAGTALAGSSPWHGEENQVSPVTAPLAAVFYLAKATENRLAEVSSEVSVTRLFTTTFVPVFVPDGPAMILNAWADILERVPSYDLSFAPDERVVSFCLSATARR